MTPEQCAVDAITKECPQLKVHVNVTAALDSPVYIFHIDETSGEPLLQKRFSMTSLDARTIRFQAMMAGRALAETRRTGMTHDWIDGKKVERRIFAVDA